MHKKHDRNIYNNNILVKQEGIFTIYKEVLVMEGRWALSVEKKVLLLVSEFAILNYSLYKISKHSTRNVHTVTSQKLLNTF